MLWWESLGGHNPEELAAFDGLYIGGGNTYRLLRQIRDRGWFDPLLMKIRSGLPTFGGSAGAIILGKNILSSHDPDPHPELHLNTDGLNLFNGASIWCHYEATEKQQIKTYIENFNIPVWACSEASGIVLEDGRIKIIGFESVYRFTDQGDEEIIPGTNLSYK